MSKNFCLKIINPSDPTGEKVEAIFSPSFYLNVYKYSPLRYENLRVARYVLENPKRIFAGIREFNPGGWCFTGKPKEWYVSPESIGPFPDNLVFAVYLNSRYYVFEARAEPRSADDTFCPENWQDRYKALIWKSTF